MKVIEYGEKSCQGMFLTSPKNRMTDEELKKLETCCERTGLSKADVIRMGIDKIYQETQK